MTSIETKYTNECQIRMKWKLKEGEIKNIQSEYLKSKSYKTPIPGVQYHLRLYPNDDNLMKAGAYLHLEFESAKSVMATFTISIKSASNEYTLKNKVYEESHGWGRKFCTRDELFNIDKKYFVDGTMEIELEVVIGFRTLKPQGLKRKAAEPLFLGALFWESEDDKDITIIVEKKQIKVHKFILCAPSSVFKAELNSGLKEDIERRITITDFTYETVQIAVEFFYEHDIKDLVNDDNAPELLHFSDKYDVKSLHAFLQTTLIEKLSEENVVQLANMCETSNAHELREYCICFLMNSAKHSIIIEDIEDLKDDISGELVRRSFHCAA